MAWSAVGAWHGSHNANLTVSNQAIGNLLIVEVLNFSNSTVWATGLSGGGATWVQAGVKFSGTTNPFSGAVFFGTVTATGAGTVTPTWSGTAPASFSLASNEFNSTVGSWVFDKQGNLDQASGNNWASLTATFGAGELYFGFAAAATAAGAGSTSGYVYNADVDTVQNGAAYNVNCPATATFPVWTDGAELFGIMVLVAETSGGSLVMPHRGGQQWRRRFRHRQHIPYPDDGPAAVAVADVFSAPELQYGQWAQRAYAQYAQRQLESDPLLLTTAELENELLGGADTARHMAGAYYDRRLVPQQRERESDPNLLNTALLENELLGGGDTARHAMWFTDRRMVPQQRTYVSDPLLLTTAELEGVLLGGGDTARHQHAAAYTDRREVPQQRERESDPNLLNTALLENELLGGGDTARHAMWFTDRRLVPQQRERESDPNLLGTALLENELLGGGDTGRHYSWFADRREVPQQRAYVSDPNLLAPAGDDQNLNGWDWIVNGSAYWDRRWMPQQLPRESDPLLLLTAELENELLGGADTDRHRHAAAYYARWWMPQQPPRLRTDSVEALLTNNLEGGTNGVTISTGNSGGASGDSFDVINVQAGATLTYDSTVAVHGGLSALATVSGSASAANARWSVKLGIRPKIWFREYLYFTAIPTAETRIFTYTTDGLVNCAYINVDTTGHLVFKDAINVIRLTSTNVIPLNQWFRIEGFVANSGTKGQMELKIFTGDPDEIAPDETLTTTASFNTQGSGGVVWYGMAGVITLAGPFNFDDVGVSTTGYLGPSVPDVTTMGSADTARRVLAAAYWDRRLYPQQRAYISDPSFYPSGDVTDPLTLAWGAGGPYWHLYNSAASHTDRRLVPAQRDRESDPNLLVTALLENELLGGAETFKRYGLAATHAARWWMPEQPPRLADPLLIATALLENELLGGGDTGRHYLVAAYADRREYPQQRLYISDPSFYPTTTPTDPLAVAYGAGGNYWHLYNRAADITDRREVPQQRAYISDPLLLTTAELENELLGGADTGRHYLVACYWDRREVPQQRSYTNPPSTAQLENELLGGAETFKRTTVPATHADRRLMPQQRQFYAVPGLPLDPTLAAWNDLARRYLAAATHRDRRLYPAQRVYFFPPPPPPDIIPADGTATVTEPGEGRASLSGRDGGSTVAGRAGGASVIELSEGSTYGDTYGATYTGDGTRTSPRPGVGEPGEGSASVR